jgi:dimethylhistidine N-methyltransferase
MASPEIESERLSLYVRYSDTEDEAFAENVRQGLSAPHKTLPAKYFYDTTGSKLYEQICAVPEYYPYRAEQEILARYAPDIHAAIHALALVELGPGNAAKTRYLLNQYEGTGQAFVYCPIDISRSMLEATAAQLLHEYCHLRIRAMHADFSHDPGILRSFCLDKKAIAFFGSNLGNLTPEESLTLLQGIAATMSSDDVLLLGIDLKKSPAILEPAYDDAQGVTAAFNLNILQRINTTLGANFCLQNFAHLAFYNAAQGRIEMHLRSRLAQTVTIQALGLTVHFAANETVHTENSYKYDVEDIRILAQRAHLTLRQTWFDSQHYFLLGLFVRKTER